MMAINTQIAHVNSTVDAEKAFDYPKDYYFRKY